MATSTVQPTPLNAGTKRGGETTLIDTPVPRKRRLQVPKLTTHEFTAPSMVASIVGIGRATSEEYERNKGRRSHASFLAAVIRRAARWASEVAPQHTLPQFVIAARTLASSRPVRAIVADIRLAQLRGADVTNNVSNDKIVDDLDQDDDLGTNAPETNGSNLTAPHVSKVPDGAGSGHDGHADSTVRDGDSDGEDDDDTVIRRHSKRRSRADSSAEEGVLAGSGPVMADVPDDIDDLLKSGSTAPMPPPQQGPVVGGDDDGWDEPDDIFFDDLEDSIRPNHKLRDLFPSRHVARSVSETGNENQTDIALPTAASDERSNTHETPVVEKVSDGAQDCSSQDGGQATVTEAGPELQQSEEGYRNEMAQSLPEGEHSSGLPRLDGSHS